MTTARIRISDYLSPFQFLGLASLPHIPTTMCLELLHTLGCDLTYALPGNPHNPGEIGLGEGRAPSQSIEPLEDKGLLPRQSLQATTEDGQILRQLKAVGGAVRFIRERWIDSGFVADGSCAAFGGAGCGIEAYAVDRRP
jgi:hypothetical protein